MPNGLQCIVTPFSKPLLVHIKRPQGKPKLCGSFMMRRAAVVTALVVVGLVLASIISVNEAGESALFGWLSSLFGEGPRRRLASWPRMDGFTGNYGPATARWPQSQFISWTSGESTETVDAVVAVTSCPAGKYRGGGNSIYARSNGQRVDGCQWCPRGRYGATTGLTAASCTDNCPKGRYRDQKGAINSNDCFVCPPGKVSHLVGSYVSIQADRQLLTSQIFVLESPVFRSATCLGSRRRNAMGTALLGNTATCLE